MSEIAEIYDITVIAVAFCRACRFLCRSAWCFMKLLKVCQNCVNLILKAIYDMAGFPEIISVKALKSIKQIERL